MSKNGMTALAAGLALGATNAYLLKKRAEDKAAKAAPSEINPTDQRLADGTQTAPDAPEVPPVAPPAAAVNEYERAWKNEPPAPDAQPLPFVGAQG